jgi:hypothetical protein
MQNAFHALRFEGTLAKAGVALGHQCVGLAEDCSGGRLDGLWVVCK